jgi:hypothetical protein
MNERAIFTQSSSGRTNTKSGSSARAAKYQRDRSDGRRVWMTFSDIAKAQVRNERRRMLGLDLDQAVDVSIARVWKSQPLFLVYARRQVHAGSAAARTMVIVRRDANHYRKRAGLLMLPPHPRPSKTASSLIRRDEDDHAHISIHYGTRNSAPTPAQRVARRSPSSLMRLRRCTITDEIALFFVDSPALSRRLAEAINDAVKPAELITTTQSGRRHGGIGRCSLGRRLLAGRGQDAAPCRPRRIREPPGRRLPAPARQPDGKRRPG